MNFTDKNVDSLLKVYVINKISLIKVSYQKVRFLNRKDLGTSLNSENPCCNLDRLYMNKDLLPLVNDPNI